MKLTELQIEDFVLYKNLPYYFQIVSIDGTGTCRLRTLVSDRIDEFGNKDYEAITTRIEDISPILLTEEILEKNEFIYEKIAQSGKIEERYVNRKNGEIQMLLGCFKGEPYVSIAGTYKKLDYVHQLQHIIRFYGLNELADNFKI